MKLKLLGFFAFVSACSTIARFDQYSYSQSVSLKVDALNLMQTATGPFASYEKAVNDLNVTMSKVYEYERNRPQNEISSKMWELMRDTSGHLYGGFINRWQKEKVLDKAFIHESTKLVGEAFDQIAQLESGKIKPSQINN